MRDLFLRSRTTKRQADRNLRFRKEYHHLLRKRRNPCRKRDDRYTTSDAPGSIGIRRDALSFTQDSGRALCGRKNQAPTAERSSTNRSPKKFLVHRGTLTRVYSAKFADTFRKRDPLQPAFLNRSLERRLAPRDVKGILVMWLVSCVGT